MRKIKTQEKTEVVNNTKSRRIYKDKSPSSNNEIRRAYINSLPEDKQLAIFLHNSLCKMDHTEECPFFHELNGFVDDWGRSSHREYLEKSRRVLATIKDTIAENEITLKDNTVDVIKLIVSSVMEF